MQCPGVLTEVSTTDGYVLACDVSWTMEPWWGITVQDGFTLAAAISVLWATAWVFRQLQRVA